MDKDNDFSGVDRRKYPRVNANVNYSVEDLRLSEKMQSTKNISAGGIAFFAREQVDVGAVLDLEMDLPDMSTVKTKARVVWREPIRIPEDSSICCELGVEFLEVDDAVRKKIARYVFLRLDIN